MEKPKFEFYERPNGHNEFLEFLENLPQKDQAKLMAVIYKDHARKAYCIFTQTFYFLFCAYFSPFTHLSTVFCEGTS